MQQLKAARRAYDLTGKLPDKKNEPYHRRLWKAFPGVAGYNIRQEKLHKRRAANVLTAYRFGMLTLDDDEIIKQLTWNPEFLDKLIETP